MYKMSYPEFIFLQLCQKGLCPQIFTIVKYSRFALLHVIFQETVDIPDDSNSMWDLATQPQESMEDQTEEQVVDQGQDDAVVINTTSEEEVM